MTKELFLQELALIQRITAWVASRHGLGREDAQDFASTVSLRLIENDYAILRRFEGKSALKTYLVTVVNRVYLDFQVQRFGKWRSSAQARRLGPMAVRLERLLHRDGLTLDEACGVLRTEGVTESPEALRQLSGSMPSRAQRRAVSSDGAEAPDPSTATT